MATAVAYYRTSSATNVGEDKDSRKRQEDAVRAYAAREGIEIVGEYYDAAVRGSDAVSDRPGFSDMLAYIDGNGARIILVENASRFARDLIVQLTGYDFLKQQGISLIPVDCPTHFLEDTPTAILIRQVLGAVSQFEKAGVVDKLRKGRERKRREHGRCEGRKPVPAETVKIANECHIAGMTLGGISIFLSQCGHHVMKTDKVTGLRVTTNKPYGRQSVKLMLRGKS